MNENTHCSVNGCTSGGQERIYDPVARVEAKGKGMPMGYHGFTINFCLQHALDLAAWRHSSAREAMAEVESEGLLTRHSQGWTYVIRMRNGNVKIGKSKGLAGRLIRLSDKRNGHSPVHVLAVLKGGTTRELMLHDQWLHLRAKGQMEEFHAEPELLRWAEEQGIHEEADLEEFYEWQAKKNTPGADNRNHRAEWAEKLNVAISLTGDLRVDPRMQAEETNEEEGWDW